MRCSYMDNKKQNTALHSNKCRLANYQQQAQKGVEELKRTLEHTHP